MALLDQSVPQMSPSEVPVEKSVPLPGERVERILATRAKWRKAAEVAEAKAVRARARHAKLIAASTHAGYFEIVCRQDGLRGGQRAIFHPVWSAGPGFAAWDRYIVRAVALEHQARRAQALSKRGGRALQKYMMIDSLSGSAGRIVSSVILKASVGRARAEDEKVTKKRIEGIRERMETRLSDGRMYPLDAITLKPVIFDQQRRGIGRQKLAMATASKFKGSKSAALVRAEQPEDDLVAPISPDRAALIRMNSELERNRRKVPTKWDAFSVDLWLQAAYETLFRIPVRVLPRQFGTCMPTPTEYANTDWADEVARASNDDGDEVSPLFGIARLRALGMPEKYEVDRMDDALRWPLHYLTDDPMAAKVVGSAAMWKALDITFTGEAFRKLCHKRFGMWPVKFDRIRGMGLMMIAHGLNAKNIRATAW